VPSLQLGVGLLYSLQTRQTAAVSTSYPPPACLFAIFTSAANFQQLFIYIADGAGTPNGGSSSPLKINKDYDKMNVLIYVKLPQKRP